METYWNHNAGTTSIGVNVNALTLSKQFGSILDNMKVNVYDYHMYLFQSKGTPTFQMVRQQLWKPADRLPVVNICVVGEKAVPASQQHTHGNDVCIRPFLCHEQ